MTSQRTNVLFKQNDRRVFVSAVGENLLNCKEREVKHGVGWFVLQEEPLCLNQVAMWTINYFDIAEEFLSDRTDLLKLNPLSEVNIH